jgi:hypothetical protein
MAAEYTNNNSYTRKGKIIANQDGSSGEKAMKLAEKESTRKKTSPQKAKGNEKKH